VARCHYNFLNVMKSFRNGKSTVKQNRIYQLLSEDLKNNGTPIQLGDDQVYYKKYGFLKKQECKYDATFDRPVAEIDFAANDLYSYNLHEYDFQTIWEEKYREYRAVARNQCSNECQNKQHCRGKCVYFDRLTFCYRQPLSGSIG
jgi:hypothetical protein